MKALRIILAAVAVFAFQTIWGMYTCGHFFSWVYSLPPVSVWRAPLEMTTTFWVINFIGHLILSVVFVLVFLWIQKGLPWKGVLKGISFGIIVWLIGTLPGIFSSAMFMSVNPVWPVYMLISQFLALLVSGLITSSILLFGRTGD